jgi:hypothetical protein
VGRRSRIVRAFSFPEGMPPPLLVMILLSSSMAGVFVVAMLLPDTAPTWLRVVLSALAVPGLMLLTATLLRRAAAQGGRRRAG